MSMESELDTPQANDAAVKAPIESMKKRLRQGAKLIVIDPRRIDLVRMPHVEAQYHLALRPGTNAAILNALAHTIVTEGLMNEAFIREPGHIEYCGKLGLGVYDRGRIQLKEIQL